MDAERWAGDRTLLGVSQVADIGETICKKFFHKYVCNIPLHQPEQVSHISDFLTWPIALILIITPRHKDTSQFLSYKQKEKNFFFKDYWYLGFIAST